ncbi:4-hydroxy-tetrahydrodipicolinate synthase [Flavobacterium sp. CS20]|uniref:4-hydroxy-tetrahydrodipicolinate synthase n=1 Tax=Flavobacterium sp. CS20 TaxID=2775246 RepID=UPI001B3A2312|nr:4-hydroxy-tetrahydrodipicolinate synthase [Flavobacterium sp. CS20]QTY28330.1 4-hydroxy-tetrahydrodipicolinate synthase [Flavobacterium sp. CS20]
MNKFIGTGVALITPFDEQGKVDTSALEDVVQFQIENGINYFVVLGTTAESATLNQEEKELVKKTIIETNKGQLPLVLGLGSNNTQALVDEIKNTDLTDFDAILSVSPYYNKPTQNGIYAHFEAIAKASPKPIILYNVPGRTASNIAPETVVELAKNFKNIIGIKEAAGDIVQAYEFIQQTPKDFLVISGDDMITLPMVLGGGSGVISVIAQGFPKLFSDMVKLGLEGKSQEAFKLHHKIAPAIEMIFEQGNPAGIKSVLKHLNLSEDYLRLPLVNIDKNLDNRLKDFIKKLD